MAASQYVRKGNRHTASFIYAQAEGEAPLGGAERAVPQHLGGGAHVRRVLDCYRGRRRVAEQARVDWPAGHGLGPEITMRQPDEAAYWSD